MKNKKIMTFSLDETTQNLLLFLPESWDLKSKSEAVEKSIAYAAKALAPEVYDKIKAGNIEKSRGETPEQFKDL